MGTLTGIVCSPTGTGSGRAGLSLRLGSADSMRGTPFVGGEILREPLTFAAVAERERIITCFGFDCPVAPKAHTQGWANMSSGILHWSPRRVTKAGLRRYLMLVASIKHSHNRGQPKWLQIYEQNVFAARRGLSEYHVRIPRRLSLTDRAKVRHLMALDGVLADKRWSHVAKWSMER